MATNPGGSMVCGDAARSRVSSLVPVVRSVACLVAALFSAAFSQAAAPAKSFPGLGPPGNAVGLELYAGDAAKLVGPDASLQIVATTRFDSGQLRDVTHLARYTVDPAGIVAIDATGLVRPMGDGAATITAVGPSEHRATVRVTVQDFADPPPVNFANQVVPIFTKLTCNSGGCHGKSGGQNGFQLSLLGFDAAADFAHLVKEARGRRLFPNSPDQSLLLLKATGTLAHGGGARLKPDSEDYRLIRRWIQQGMPVGSADDRVLVQIHVHPEHRTLTADGRQQLSVIAEYSDGSMCDVTHNAQYLPNNTDMAKADEAGLVEMLGEPGEVAVMVRYQGQAAAFLATIPLGAPVTDVPPERNFIDREIVAKLKELGLPPSGLCDDSTFLRRVTIDIAGRIPTYAETQEFLADADPAKRDKLIDRLLASDDYAELFAQKWSAILRNRSRENVSRSGNFAFHAWVRASLKNNVPYDQWVRTILTAAGDVHSNPPVNWYQNVPTMNDQVEDMAQVFLGLRIQCARCHHHPYEKWGQNDYWGLAAFFANVRRKPGFEMGESRIYAQRGEARARHPGSGEMLAPTSLGGESPELSADDDPRLALADWMSHADNPYFAKSLVNRYWKHFFNRGIVEPEDDMRATNPPTHPALLEALAAHFVASKYDLKELARTICRSSAYQLTATPNEYNAGDKQSFSRYYPRRLHAEVLLDSIDELLDSRTRFGGLPAGMRAVQLPDHGTDSFFLNIFGRPAGGSACECERTGEISMSQSLHLMNSSEVYGKLAGGRLASLVDDKERSDREKLTDLYLRAFSRPPTEVELGQYLDHIATFAENERRQAYEDILWALINTKEFMFNH